MRSLDLFPPHVLSQARRIFDDFARHLRKFGTRARHGETKVSANLVFELKGEPKLLQNWASEPVSWVEVQNNRNFSMAHKATLLISYKKGCVESENHHFEKEHLQKLCGLFPVTVAGLLSLGATNLSDSSRLRKVGRKTDLLQLLHGPQVDIPSYS